MVQFVKTCHPLAFLSTIATLLGPSVAYYFGTGATYWKFPRLPPPCVIQPCPPQPPGRGPPGLRPFFIPRPALNGVPVPPPVGPPGPHPPPDSP
ncbi:hypothetical protein PGT21_033371 [Puccinia graminis f. sp. tritici]|uniref:Uncharacterized protein n=1 Tax=Puccinia graminis f. sp. tritici TaxID=56615 RepID=A0A5B0NA17_PUCGR|nr:hypothetical protein PGTUg99_003225 [Puccinia graminis f. sp. tritici]KAA1084639.1 hypothetical protein PGT21_033371 [Puccinia graminis f. sp. tritici]